MSTDINELLRRLGLYLGVPLTAREQEVANRLYAEVIAQVKALQQECKVAQLARPQTAQRYEGPRV